MEGPMMSMDAMVDKPENYGLPPGWSENMQGMMTFVRVLPAAQYDEVMRRVATKQPGESQHGSMPGMDHGSMPGMDHGSMPGMDMPANEGGRQ